jgi:hypothetical protein
MIGISFNFELGIVAINLPNEPVLSLLGASVYIFISLDPIRRTLLNVSLIT